MPSRRGARFARRRGVGADGDGVWAGSAETGARRLFGNTPGWRRAWGNRQVRPGGNERSRDRGAPWKPVALEGGVWQSCSVALERVGTRLVVGGFGEKCRDRIGMTRLQRGGLGGKGGCQPNKAVVVSADWGLPISGVPLPKLDI